MQAGTHELGQIVDTLEKSTSSHRAYHVGVRPVVCELAEGCELGTYGGRGRGSGGVLIQAIPVKEKVWKQQRSGIRKGVETTIREDRISCGHDLFPFPEPKQYSRTRNPHQIPHFLTRTRNPWWTRLRRCWCRCYWDALPRRWRGSCRC